jgi:V8-like Glu-specific endopeptidase
VLRQYGLSREGRIVYINHETSSIAYSISTLSGQGGAPVCIGDKIIALHWGSGKGSEDFNLGRLITYELLANL